MCQVFHVHQFSTAPMVSAQLGSGSMTSCTLPLWATDLFVDVRYFVKQLSSKQTLLAANLNPQVQYALSWIDHFFLRCSIYSGQKRRFRNEGTLEPITRILSQHLVQGSVIAQRTRNQLLAARGDWWESAPVLPSRTIFRLIESSDL